MWRAISFFSKSNDAQFESGAIQDTRILTGSAFDAPCARSEIAATSPISQDRTSHMSPSHAGACRKLTVATVADKPQPRPFRSCFRRGQSLCQRPQGAAMMIVRREKSDSYHPPEKCSLDDDGAHARSAADIERLASHKAIGPIAEEHHSPRDIVAAAQSLHRNGRGKRLLAFAVLWNDTAEHLGVRDRPGCHHIHGDTIGREFERPGACHPDHSSLGRRIGGARL